MARVGSSLGPLTHLGELHGSVEYNCFPAPDVEHDLLCHYDRDRRAHFMHIGCLWFLAFPIPRTRFLVRPINCNYLSSLRSNDYSNLYLLPKNWLAGHMAASHCSRLLCQRLRCFSPPAVFHDPAARTG